MSFMLGSKRLSAPSVTLPESILMTHHEKAEVCWYRLLMLSTGSSIPLPACSMGLIVGMEQSNDDHSILENLHGLSSTEEVAA